jgi:hypothetical protein
MLRCRVLISFNIYTTFIKSMKPDNLPDRNVSGLVTVSDFYAHQHEAIKSALKNSQIPHQLEFYVYRNGAFRVYVPEQYL